MKQESAVSPVIGILLMLVVTIIIAAVVSSFAGGFASGSSKAPQARLAVSPSISNIQDEDTTNWVSDYPDGFTADNGILFEHQGGDSFSLTDVNVQIQSQDTKIMLNLTSEMPSSNCATSTYYIKKVGAGDAGTYGLSNEQTMINPGDQFMVVADNCRIDPFGPQISFKPQGSYGGFGAYTNTNIGYQVIDRKSGKTIQEGSFILK